MLKAIIKSLYRIYNWPIRRLFIAKEKNYPKVSLSDVQIKNTVLLPDRTELLKRLPNQGVFAEIGVDEGAFSKEIIETCKPKKLVLIDNWATRRYNSSKRKKVEQDFKQQLSSGQVEIINSLSVDAAEHFENEYFDWIYIDTDHSYATTAAELRAYAPKIKRNGIIAGHDYCQGSWTEQVRYGVIEAINEFCVSENWELIFLTIETNFPPSFAIRKIV